MTFCHRFSLRLNAVLTDEAVFTVARLVVPLVTVIFPHKEAFLVIVHIVWFTSSPVLVTHGMVYENERVAIPVPFYFPHKLVHVVALSCCPNSDSMGVTMTAMRPTCKQSTSKLCLSNNNIICLKTAALIYLMLYQPPI